MEEDVVRLSAYQADAIRLLLRDLRRPKGFPRRLWTDLRGGNAQQLPRKRLKELLEINPRLREALDFWDPGTGVERNPFRVRM
jgi:hypothetical protein